MSFFKSKKVAQQQSEIEILTQERDELRMSQEAIGKRAVENENRVEELQRNVDELQHKVDSLTKENAELTAELDTEEPYEKVFNERQNLLEENSNSKAKIKEMENGKHALTEEIETSKRNTENVIKEKEDAVRELETIKQTNDQLESERGELEQRIDELEKKNNEFEDEMVKLRQDLDNIKAEKLEMNRLLEEQQEQEATKNRAYIEDLRKELTENKNKVESMLLESEALKSENESLFRANETKKEDINEIQKEVTSIKNELQIERLRYKKLKEEWEQEKKSTEFVLISKSARRNRTQNLETFKEENDSEEEHVVGVVEAASAEREELKKKENELKKRINQLQTDKEELFRSGTTLFTENKSLSAKYDLIVGERTTLLQVEAALKRKVRGQEQDIKDLKKTIDDLYYQNIAIRSNEENESKRSSYVVVMGNEMIKELEREKSALHRRVKFLEQENSEIEARVIELEKQSEDLVNYTKKYDKPSKLPDVGINRDFSDRQRSRNRFLDSDWNRGSAQYKEKAQISDIVRRKEYERRDGSGRRDERERRSSTDRFFDYQTSSDKAMPYDDHRDNSRTHTIMSTRSPDYYKSNAPPFNNSSSRQTSVRSIHSQSSRVSLPPLGSRGSRSPRPTTQSPTFQERKRITPLTTRR